MAYMQRFGAVPSKVDIRNYVASVSATDEEFPESFELDMCAVKNQGSVGSCVAHSIAEVVEYFNRLQEGSYVKMSTGYIYGNRTGMNYNGEGMFTADALKNTVKFGDVRNDLFDVNVEVPQAINMFQEKAFELSPYAQPNRFTSYFQLGSINAIKANLIKNGPVVFVIKWYSDLKVVKGMLIHDESNNKVEGHHCMVIYGWDNRGWKIQNSWGTSWGQGGRAILPFTFKLSEAYGVIDTISEKTNQEREAQYNAMVKDYEEKIKELNLTLESLQTAEEANKQQLVEALKEVKKLQSQLEESDGSIESLEKTIEELNTHINNAKQTYIELKKEYDKNKQELDEYSKQIEDQKKTINILEQELIDIKKPYENWNKVIIKIINWFANLFRKK